MSSQAQERKDKESKPDSQEQKKGVNRKQSSTLLFPLSTLAIPHVQIDYRTSDGFCGSARSLEPFLRDWDDTVYVSMRPVFPKHTYLVSLGKDQTSLDEWKRIVAYMDQMETGWNVENPLCSSYGCTDEEPDKSTGMSSSYDRYHHLCYFGRRETRAVETFRWKPISLYGVNAVTEPKYRMQNADFARAMDRYLETAWTACASCKSPLDPAEILARQNPRPSSWIKHDEDVQLCGPCTRSRVKGNENTIRKLRMNLSNGQNECWRLYTDDVWAPEWWERVSGNGRNDFTRNDIEMVLKTHGRYLTAAVYGDILRVLTDPSCCRFKRETIDTIGCLRNGQGIYTSSQWRDFGSRLRRSTCAVWLQSIACAEIDAISTDDLAAAEPPMMQTTTITRVHIHSDKVVSTEVVEKKTSPDPRDVTQLERLKLLVQQQMGHQVSYENPQDPKDSSGCVDWTDSKQAVAALESRIRAEVQPPDAFVSRPIKTKIESSADKSAADTKYIQAADAETEYVWEPQPKEQVPALKMPLMDQVCAQLDPFAFTELNMPDCRLHPGRCFIPGRDLLNKLLLAGRRDIQYQRHPSRCLAMLSVHLEDDENREYLYTSIFTVYRDYVGITWDFGHPDGHRRVLHLFGIPGRLETIMEYLLEPMSWKPKEYDLLMGFWQPRPERSRIVY